MEGRALRLLLVMVVAAVVAIWIFKPRKKAHVATEQPGILPPGANARLEGVTLLQESPQGDFTMTAHDAEWSRVTNTVQLDHVDIRFVVLDTAGGSHPGHITGERGE